MKVSEEEITAGDLTTVEINSKDSQTENLEALKPEIE